MPRSLVESSLALARRWPARPQHAAGCSVRSTGNMPTCWSVWGKPSRRPRWRCRAEQHSPRGPQALTGRRVRRAKGGLRDVDARVADVRATANSTTVRRSFGPPGFEPPFGPPGMGPPPEGAKAAAVRRMKVARAATGRAKAGTVEGLAQVRRHAVAVIPRVRLQQAVRPIRPFRARPR